jgi:hypothetical protein
MKIIGHPWLESERFVPIDTIEAIKDTAPASILLLGEGEETRSLIRYCRKQALPFALKTEDTKMMLIAHQSGARYILTQGEYADTFQKLAQHYLFDTEILVVIEKEEEIVEYAHRGIDGVIFASAISNSTRSADAQ